MNAPLHDPRQDSRDAAYEVEQPYGLPVGVYGPGAFGEFVRYVLALIRRNRWVIVAIIGLALVAALIAAISYSLYLCHMPCAYISAAIVLNWATPAVNVNWVYCLLALFTSLMVATLSYVVFETYCDRSLKKIFRIEAAATKKFSV